MLKNYFKVAWRNLVKTKAYSAINIGGLSVGIAIAMLIGLWLYDELSYNKYHSNYDRIAAVWVKGSLGGQRWAASYVQRPLEMVMRSEYGNNFKHVVMSRYEEEHILSVGEKKLSQSGRFMQSAAPEMLSLRMRRGSHQSLADRSSVLISSSLATALFGKDDPINQVIKLDNKTNLKVTGVYEDIPYNSEFRNMKFLCHFDLTLALNPWMEEALTEWNNTSFLMYVQVAENKDIQSASNAIRLAVHDHVSEEDKKFNFHTFLVPMSRWHLYSEWRDGVNTGGRIQFVWLFGIIGVFVLMLACINFMNLSTARSEKRSREVGIRKAMGSVRKQLVSQFLTESFLVVLISFVFATALVMLFLNWFNELADKRMEMMWWNPLFWVVSTSFIVVTSLIAGSYPAFYLSSFNPVKVLKGTFQAGPMAAVPRKILVVVQFTVSVALIIGTIMVYRQIEHAKNRPVGYERDGLLSIQIKSEDLLNNVPVITQQLKARGIASEVAASSSPLTEIWSNNGGFEWRGRRPDQVQGFGVIYVTHDYGKAVGWQFKEGRDFSRDFSLDSMNFSGSTEPTYSAVINEAAARYMNFDKPIGEILKLNGYKFQIVGVIRDMLVESPFSTVRHVVYFLNYPQANAYINVRLDHSIGIPAAISGMEEIFTRVVPSVPFEYSFADDAYAMKFAAEERIGKLAAVFASLAIFISCLGLFGLASFVAEKRTKEIGIRKVLGASVYNLCQMLSKDFVVLILLACVIATPLSYYFLNEWLQRYEYRTTISWWVFAVAIGGALLITLLTVSFQAIKAALSNPIKSLRSE